MQSEAQLVAFLQHLGACAIVAADRPAESTSQIFTKCAPNAWSVSESNIRVTDTFIARELLTTRGNGYRIVFAGIREDGIRGTAASALSELELQNEWAKDRAMNANLMVDRVRGFMER